MVNYLAYETIAKYITIDTVGSKHQRLLFQIVGEPTQLVQWSVTKMERLPH